MDNLEKKEIIKSNILFAIFSITILTILTILCVFCEKNNLKNKAEAYTTDIVSYSSDTITDLTGTTWKLNSTINLGLNETFNVDISYEDYTLDSIRFLAEDWSGEGLYTYGFYFGSYMIVEGHDITPDTRQQLFIITGGDDVTNSNLISWLQSNAILQTPQLPTYTINANLTNVNIDSIFPMTVTSEDIISLSFVPQAGYIFNTYEWTIETDISPTYTNFVEENFKISFDMSNIRSDITINIVAHSYENLKGQWILKDYSSLDFSYGEILENVSFVSNGNVFNTIVCKLDGVVDYVKYDEYNEVVTRVGVLSSNGAVSYLPTTTYSYNMIEITNDIYGYNGATGVLVDTTRFLNFYRRATTEDIAQINYKNGQLSMLEEEYTFIHLFGAIVDAPITALKGLLNFNFFGINLFSFLTLFVTLAIVFLCITMLKGGKKNE